MMKVQNDLSVNIQLDPDILLKKYERQIRDLKLELAMHDTLVGRGRVSYEPYSREQQYEQQLIAEQFLRGDKDDIDISSIRQVKELFIQFRNLYRNVLRQAEESEKAGSPLKPATKVGHSHGQASDDKKFQAQDQKEKTGVGVEEKRFGFGLGKAPKESKPTFPMDSSFMGKKEDQLVKDDKNRIEMAHKRYPQAYQANLLEKRSIWPTYMVHRI